MEIIKAEIYKKYDNYYVFHKAPISIEEGEIYLVIGRNGIGKSTLLRLLARVDSFDWNSKLLLDINHWDPKKRFHRIDKKDISYTPSFLVYYKNMKVKDLLHFYKNTTDNFDIEYAFEHIAFFKLGKNQVVSEMSDGQKKILSFVIGLSFNCSLYVIDEPFPNVDLLNDEHFRKMIINKYNEKTTFIIATHQISEFEKIASKYIFIKDKNDLEISNTDDIRLQSSISIEDYFKEQLKCLE